MIPGTLLVTFLLDQLSKFLILKTLSGGQSIPLLPPVFHLTLVRNTGIAFGLFRNYPQFLFSINVLILAVLFILIGLRLFKQPILRIGIGMIAGGGLGNLVDRLRFGTIVDFLDFHIGSFHWPVFNIADSAICVGTGLLLWALFQKG